MDSQERDKLIEDYAFLFVERMSFEELAEFAREEIAASLSQYSDDEVYAITTDTFPPLKKSTENDGEI